MYHQFFVIDATQLLGDPNSFSGNAAPNTDQPAARALWMEDVSSDPKCPWKMKAFCPEIMGEITTKNEGYGFPWYYLIVFDLHKI